MAKTVYIGKSDVSTIKLGLGTNKVGGHNLFKGLVDADGAAVVRTALKAGITLLDTAYMYGLGRSEEIIGEVLKKNGKRSDTVIATKAAQDPDDDLNINNRPEFLKKAVDDALERLQTDYIDIFYIHFPDDGTPKAEAVGALAEAKKAGKIRAIGVSNFSPAQLKEANADALVDVVENHYSLVHRQAEKELWPYLKDNDISFVPYFPLASGLLTGKYHSGQTFTDDQWQAKNPNFQGERYAHILQAVEHVRNLAGRHQATVAQLILAWYIANPAIGVVIPGARKAEQVAANVKALNVRLSEDDYRQIDRWFAAF
ncbi:MAG: aldo/keto reductase [Sporolactobacillus sp.]|jgi:aryl-alcohol dehydrogenase-like predicted oxidoreductase|nr:aldo/keto reductase [Sporolactobacillus sp.]